MLVLKYPPGSGIAIRFSYTNFGTLEYSYTSPFRNEIVSEELSSSYSACATCDETSSGILIPSADLACPLSAPRYAEAGVTAQRFAWWRGHGGGGVSPPHASLQVHLASVF